MRVTGPLFSIEAHGSLAGLFTAATSRGRQYMKKRTTPRTAYTSAQRSARCRLAFLKALWRRINTISGVDAQALWAAEADLSITTAYSYFLTFNARRWSTEEGPILLPSGNPPGTGNPVGGDITYTATTARIKAFGGFDATMWGWAVYMRTTSDDPQPVEELAFVSPDYIGVTSPRFFTITNIPPGTWVFMKRAFNTDGTFSAADSIGTHTFP